MTTLVIYVIHICPLHLSLGYIYVDTVLYIELRYICVDMLCGYSRYVCVQSMTGVEINIYAQRIVYCDCLPDIYLSTVQLHT